MFVVVIAAFRQTLDQQTYNFWKEESLNFAMKVMKIAYLCASPGKDTIVAHQAARAQRKKIFYRT